MKRMFVPVVVLALLGMASPGWAGSPEQIVTGTGNFRTQVTRTTETLQPTCVQLVTRPGQAEFSGFITNSLGNSQFESRAMRDACADPVQGTFRWDIHLEEATVAGLTGDLVIEVHGVFEGDATSPSGARTRAHGTITGISGKLKGAHGRFQSVGQATTSSNFNTYFTEIYLKLADD
jgi:hypothetical protein